MSIVRVVDVEDLIVSSEVTFVEHYGSVGEYNLKSLLCDVLDGIFS